jgi:hypothetical protein
MYDEAIFEFAIGIKEGQYYQTSTGSKDAFESSTIMRKKQWHKFEIVCKQYSGQMSLFAYINGEQVKTKPLADYVETIFLYSKGENPGYWGSMTLDIVDSQPKDGGWRSESLVTSHSNGRCVVLDGVKFNDQTSIIGHIKLAPAGACVNGKSIGDGALSMKKKHCMNMKGSPNSTDAGPEDFVSCLFSWCTEGGIYNPSYDGKCEDGSKVVGEGTLKLRADHCTAVGGVFANSLEDFDFVDCTISWCNGRSQIVLSKSGTCLQDSFVGTACPENELNQNFFSSCAEIKQQDSSAADGTYTILPRWSFDPIEVFCDMSDDGGGWTLVAKSKNGLACTDSLLREREKTVCIYNKHSTDSCKHDEMLNADVGPSSSRIPLQV